MQLEARAMKLVLQQPLRTVERLKRNAFGAGQRKDEKHKLRQKKKEKESLTSHGTLSSGT